MITYSTTSQNWEKIYCPTFSPSCWTVGCWCTLAVNKYMGNNLNSGFKVHTITNYVGYDWLCNNGEDIKKKKEKKKKK
jgi:hypothetical protein